MLTFIKTLKIYSTSNVTTKIQFLNIDYRSGLTEVPDVPPLHQTVFTAAHQLGASLARCPQTTVDWVIMTARHRDGAHFSIFTPSEREVL